MKNSCKSSYTYCTRCRLCDYSSCCSLRTKLAKHNSCQLHVGLPICKQFCIPAEFFDRMWPGVAPLKEFFSFLWPGVGPSCTWWPRYYFSRGRTSGEGNYCRQILGSDICKFKRVTINMMKTGKSAVQHVLGIEMPTIHVSSSCAVLIVGKNRQSRCTIRENRDSKWSFWISKM